MLATSPFKTNGTHAFSDGRIRLRFDSIGNYRRKSFFEVINLITYLNGMSATAQWGLSEKRKHCDRVPILRRVLPGVEIGAKEMYIHLLALSFI